MFTLLLDALIPTALENIVGEAVQIVQTALNQNAASVVLAHNHPSGYALPSQEDLDTTRTLQTALQSVGIVLADHIIVADDDYVSLADDGYLGGSYGL